VRKFIRLVASAIAVVSSVFLAGPVFASGAQKDVERLAPPRTVVCFFDGEDFDGLVLNARGKLTFLCVDGRFADALARQRSAERGTGVASGIPQQVFAYAAKARPGKKRVLFVVKVQALKGWKFDSSLISVGGYSPSKADIITGVADDPSRELRHGERELAKGYDGFIGFLVPSEHVKPGEATFVSYASDRRDWIAPDKNQ
jgi:hypothetical protein